MLTTKSYLAIVPARLGSKSIPGKNIYNICGKPMLVWSIEAAKGSKYITKTVVSSDSEKILEIAQQYGAETIKRPSELASDDSPSEPLISHALEYLCKQGEVFDFIVLLQPTSPLRCCKDIDQAIELMCKKNADALISVFEPAYSPFKFFRENRQGYLDGLVGNEKLFMRRQELPLAYYPNGAIYIVKTTSFIKNERLLTNKTIPFLMPARKSLDIDTFDDLAKAEQLLT